MQCGVGSPAQGQQVRPLGLGLGPTPETAPHDLGHRHEVIGVTRADAAALNLVFAVVLLGRQAINKDHLGGDGVTALDMADVKALNTAGGHRQFQ